MGVSVPAWRVQSASTKPGCLRTRAPMPVRSRGDDRANKPAPGAGPASHVCPADAGLGAATAGVREVRREDGPLRRDRGQHQRQPEVGTRGGDAGADAACASGRRTSPRSCSTAGSRPCAGRGARSQTTMPQMGGDAAHETVRQRRRCLPVVRQPPSQGPLLGYLVLLRCGGAREAARQPCAYVPGRLRHRADARNTPSDVEFTVVRTADGESPDQLARLVEQLRTVYVHIRYWSMKPAPPCTSRGRSRSTWRTTSSTRTARMTTTLERSPRLKGPV